MTLLWMSLSGGCVILAAILLCALARNRLPGWTFSILRGVAAADAADSPAIAVERLGACAAMDGGGNANPRGPSVAHRHSARSAARRDCSGIRPFRSCPKRTFTLGTGLAAGLAGLRIHTRRQLPALAQGISRIRPS